MDEGERARRAPRANSGRGVAYWSDGRGDERIYVITPGYHLVALDAHNGHQIETFGNEGVVDLKNGLGRPVDPIEGIIGSSSPPVIVGETLIVGAALAVGGRPPSPENVPGHVRGFDVRTGSQTWIFHTIPLEGEVGNDTWENDSWSYTGNAAVWSPFAVDAELGYVYLPVEGATGDYYGGHRLGDNLFSSSLVALEVETGQRVWHYQIVHHDIWDYDNPTSPILVDINVDGTEIPAVVQLTKQNFAYVFDRRSGEPVWPIVERPVPASDVPGERASPTQPIPTRPAPYDRQGVRIEDLIDFTPELRAEAEEIVSRFRIGELFTPPSVIDQETQTGGTLTIPGSLGGANWEGGAVDPETGVIYVGSRMSPSVYGLVQDPEVSTMRYIQGRASARGPQRLPLMKPPYGRITAIDLNSGEHLWMIPNGDTPESIKDHPALEGLEIGRTGKPTRAGILVTKTLVFAGEGAGGDSVLRAHDKSTGEILAEIDLPGSQTGLPMTYSLEGKQYIVVAVGGTSDRSAELVALTLPD
jgi:quinoprotein glucose dehydrogenase